MDREAVTPRSVFRGRLIRTLIAAVATVAALALIVRSVQAAPTLTASQNPVEIPEPQTTKAIQLGWNFNGATPKATLTVTSNTAGQVLSQPVITAAGNVPLTVTYGQTYTAKLHNVANPNDVMASLTITTKRPAASGSHLPGTLVTNNGQLGQQTGHLQPSNGQLGPAATPEPLATIKPAPTPTATPTPAPEGCALKCITKVVVESWAEQTHLRVETDTPASITFKSSFRNEYLSQYWPPHPTTVSSNGKVKVFDDTFDMGGERGAIYDWTVTATDAHGHSAEKKGTLVVRHRVVSVFFTKVRVDNDSDPSGTGECHFTFRVNDDQYGYYENGDCTDDTEYSISVSKTVIDAPSQLTLVVQGHDSDVSVFPGSATETGETSGAYKVSGAPGSKNFFMTAYAPSEGDFTFDVSGAYVWIYE